MPTRDLLVVGCGTAGLIAAGLGAQVLVAEEDRFGRDCLRTGCVPSKALLAAGNAAADARGTDRFGVRTGEVSIDGAAVLAHVRTAIARIEPNDSPTPSGRAGADAMIGSDDTPGGG